MSHTAFDADAFRAFRSIDRDGPIHMLNLVRLHEQATGPDGTPVSGARAYARYGMASAPVLARVGGRIVWRGRPEFGLIAPADEAWDIAFIAEYPGAEAFASMLKDPEYRAAMAWRQAAVADSRLIRLAPQDPGDAFGGTG
ncbi:MAG: DUF1330 domain-containing protein [Pararhodobacter sp.]|nr:DUF1330 domain-containing protein [Pararhodobacter sp.]